MAILGMILLRLATQLNQSIERMIAAWAMRRSALPLCHSRAIPEGQPRYRVVNHGHCHPTAELVVSRFTSMNASREHA
jgi:hypothetical protein